MAMATTLGRLVGAIAMMVASAPAGAVMAAGMGGGGGGGTPSMSAPQYDPAEEFQKGQAAFKAGKYKDAARYFQHVIDSAPKAAPGWLMLGMAKSADNDDKGAVRAFEKAVKLDPGLVAAHREFGISLARIGETESAQGQLADLKARAASCAETCPDASELKESVAAVEQAIAAPKTSAWLAPARPLPLADQAAGDIAYVRAVSLINEHRYLEAQSALGRAALAFGPHPDILTYQGYVWRKLGRLDLAESYYQAALSMAPDHRGATEYYGELKVLKGDVSGARAMLARLDGECAFGCIEAEDLRRWIEHGGDPAS